MGLEADARPVEPVRTTAPDSSRPFQRKVTRPTGCVLPLDERPHAAFAESSRSTVIVSGLRRRNAIRAPRVGQLQTGENVLSTTWCP